MGGIINNATVGGGCRRGMQTQAFCDLVGLKKKKKG